MPFPNLTPKRYIEERGKAVGAEYCLMYQPLQVHAKGNIDIDLSFSSAGDIPIDTFHAFQVAAYMFPMTRADRNSVLIDSFEKAKALYDETVPKTIGTNLSGFGSPLRQGTTDLDKLIKTGDVDTNLAWQPGRINMSAYADPAEYHEVFRQRYKVGWPLGGDAHAYRTGDGVVRTRMPVGTQISFGPLMTQTYFVMMLVIPADIDDDDWDKINQYIVPRGGMWESMNWMTPQVDRITGQENIAPATADDFWRMAELWATTGDRQWAQQALDYFGTIDIHVDRSRVESNFGIPAGDAPTE